jgi:hypothetical protein
MNSITKQNLVIISCAPGASNCFVVTGAVSRQIFPLHFGLKGVKVGTVGWDFYLNGRRIENEGGGKRAFCLSTLSVCVAPCLSTTVFSETSSKKSKKIELTPEGSAPSLNKYVLY